MKLLIVEDEAVAREGLLKGLNWQEYGINSVLSAENGEAGLTLARRFQPDIVITDIRMPRMDGITMAKRLRDLFPDCRIIFLSAYSDINYYKAAIELKAVRFLDKPVGAAMLKEIILQAAAESKELRSNRSLHMLRKIHDIQAFANAICQGESQAELEKQARQLGLSQQLKKNPYVTALIITRRTYLDEEPMEELLNLTERLSKAIPQLNVFTIRQKSNCVFFLFTRTELSAFSQETVCARLETVLEGYDFSAIFGAPANGLSGGTASYAAAKKAMEKAYCFPFGVPIVYSEKIERDIGLYAYADAKVRILGRLSEKDRQGALEACGELYGQLRDRQDLVYQKARELYYELLSEVYRQAEGMRLKLAESAAEDNIFWAVRIENYNLDELHGYLTSIIGKLFDALEETRNEKRQILAIKEYIADNYANPALSVSDISSHLHMSVSHVCTMFKKETGDTINGYLTNYRLEKAKKYLTETLLSISDISLKIGYKDNSYFGRTFRKHMGLTPLEYRNRKSL